MNIPKLEILETEIIINDQRVPNRNIERVFAVRGVFAAQLEIVQTGIEKNLTIKGLQIEQAREAKRVIEESVRKVRGDGLWPRIQVDSGTSQSARNRRRILSIRSVFAALIALVVLWIASLYPVDTALIRKPWHIKVVDEKGQPIPGARVFRRWEYYPYMLDEQMDSAITDNAGIANLPSRSVRKSTIEKVKEAIVNLGYGVHASWGLSAAIDVHAAGFQGRTYLQVITEHVQLFRSLEDGRVTEMTLGKTPGDRIR